jgi:hypothetical protein
VRNMKRPGKQCPAPPMSEQNLLILRELGKSQVGDSAIESLEIGLASNGDGATSSPELIVARARQLARQEPVPTPVSPLRPVLACLVYDTQSQALPTGIRAVTQRARSLLFTAEEFEIILRVSPEAVPERLKILGQVLLEGAPVVAAAVRLDGPPGRIDGVTDDEGEFRLLDLHLGSYKMEVATAESVIEVPSLSLEGAS